MSFGEAIAGAFRLAVILAAVGMVAIFAWIVWLIWWVFT